MDATTDYHNNTVIFIREDTKPARKIISGSFKVTALSISPGQNPEEPKERNHVGDVHDLVIDGNNKASLNFLVGRHKTKEVADFWNSNIYPSQTSYDKSPEELNFAFIGTLTIQFSNPDVTAEFHSVALAQGSWEYWTPIGPKVNNDWWIGATTANYLGDGNVEVFGRGTNGEGSVTLRMNRQFHEGYMNQIYWTIEKS